MGHKNAPLTPEGRKRLIERIQTGRPISHVAAEAGISRANLAKWYARWQQFGDAGLIDHSSRPGRSPAATDDSIVQMIVTLRRAEKWGPARIAATLKKGGVEVSAATVHRVLQRQGISRLKDMDPPTGETARAVVRYEHEAAGDMLHVDVKKIGKIPTGGGWRIHGVGTDEHRASRRKGQGTGRIGYTYLHTAIDDHSRLAYTEALDDEKGATAAAFWLRAVTFFAAHGVTPIHRVLTDNGSCYRSRHWAAALAATGTRHKRTQPYRPQTNGKVERFNGTLAREWAYVRPYGSEQERRDALMPFLNYYNHERPHSALGQDVPASRVPGRDFRLSVTPVEAAPRDLLQVDGQMSLDDLLVDPTS